MFVYDTVIIGGGVMGTSVAYQLAQLRGTGEGIVVVEKDPTYKHASAMLSAGGIRQQFSCPENIQLCKYGAEFIKNMPALAVDGDTPDVQFHQAGYLFLASDAPEAIETMRQNNEIQRQQGCHWIELLQPLQLSKQFPWLNTGGIGMGSFGTQNEGYFDPWALLNAMKRKALSLGVEYLKGDVTEGKMLGDCIHSCVFKSGSEKTHLYARRFVNAAGAFAAKLVDMYGGSPSLPVAARRRSVFVFHCTPSEQHVIVPDSSPLVIDPSGVYFRPEGKGQRFICGVSPEEEEDLDCSGTDDLGIVQHHLFDQVVWPVLATGIPAFESIKLQGAWAGFYDYNTFDQNAIIGPHSRLFNLFLINGFSGHGLQQAPAAGLALAEMIEFGESRTFDVSRLAFERVELNMPVLENYIV